jgi:hypothetical protein
MMINLLLLGFRSNMQVEVPALMRFKYFFLWTGENFSNSVEVNYLHLKLIVFLRCCIALRQI